MSNYTYDYPLQREVDLVAAQAVVTIPGKTGSNNRVQVIDASARIGATPAAVTISIGDGTTVDRYGTLTIAAGATAGDAAVIVTNFTSDNYEIIDAESIVFTNTTAPAGAVTDFRVFVGYY